MLLVKDASFAYSKDSPFIFEGIDFALHPGDILCILGPNGIGKTTLLKSIVGLNLLSNGSIHVNGKNLSHLKCNEIAKLIAYVPQTHQPVFSYSVLDVVLMGRSPHIGLFSSPSEADRIIARESLQILGIESLTENPYTAISGGERQLVLLAQVLAQQAKILLLDEPTAHLDYGNQIKILTYIKTIAAIGVIVVMTSHVPDHAFMVATQVSLMLSGEPMRIGPPEQILSKSDLCRIYGIEIDIIDDGRGGKTCIPVMPGVYNQ